MRVAGQEIECITFDLDDTLWGCHAVIQRAESVFYAWLQAHHPRITTAYTPKSLIDHRQQFFSGFPEMAHDFSWLRRHWLAHLADDFGYPRSHLTEEGLEVFLQARNEVELHPGADAVLRQANARFTCGSITNGNADVVRIGIGHYFDFNITASGAGAAKPDPVIFRAAVKAAGVAPERILHIGDDPVRDIHGAAMVGMKTLWINPELRPWSGLGNPDIELRHITELSGLWTP